MSEDLDLAQFAAEGLELPPGGQVGVVEHDGARIWYSSHGEGRPVILLHGGMGHAGNFGKQVPALVAAGYCAIAVDSRGHGHSTRDGRPFSYDLMGRDVLAVMNSIGIARAPIVGWSDGACIGLVLAHDAPDRIEGVFFFACNMDPSGTKPFVGTPLIDRCFSRHVADYARLSATPDGFQDLADAVGLMQQTQPNYSAEMLAEIAVPVSVVLGEADEFITQEHAHYLARTIDGAELVILPGIGHFAPVQKPEQFNAAVLAFLRGLAG